MATYLPSDSNRNVSSFIQQLDDARISIQLVFRDLMEKLQLREATLLNQLESIKSEYKLTSQETQRELNALKAQRDFTAHNLKLNKFKELQQQQVDQLNQMISKLEMEDGKERRISWSWDSQLIETISAVGKLEVISAVRKQKLIAIDYKQKVKPVISKCKDGCNDGDLKNPWGAAVDMKTGNIYITENEKHRVKVFTSNGDFIFKFGDDKKLIYPCNICIQNDKLYLSHEHEVVIFNVDGRLLHRFGDIFKDKQLKSPLGIAISPLNSDIYICDSDNDRVQIYDSKKFEYKSTIGRGTLNCPKDIKFAQYELYILDEQDPCLHVYTTEHVYVRSLISRGPDKQIYFSYCFHIDDNCNILITDCKRHCLYIFTNRGELLHQIGGGESFDMFYPRGVTIGMDGSIIIVNEESTGKLLIY